MAKLNFAIKLGLAAQGFKQGLNGAKSSLQGFASTVKSAFGMIAGALAAGQIKAFGQECLAAFKAQQMAEVKLATVMKQRMNASDAEVKSILKLASAQQELGVIGDEVQLAGAQQVATFLKQKDSLNQLIPAMNNLLAQQKGLDATQGDAVGIANLMGKAMMGQTSALRRVGITFDEAQEKVLKYGTESERAATLAQVITDNVGNMNAELAKTDLGKIQQMENILGDTKEQIGGAIAPIVSEFAPAIANMAVNVANGITNAIGVIKNNLATIGEFIVSVFAAVKLLPIFQSWAAQAASAEGQATAAAQAATTRREMLEQQILTVKRNIAVQEAALAEATGAKEVAIANKITTLKENLAKKETALKNAQLVEQETAQAAAAAAETTTWSVAWNSIKAAGIACWTTIKAAMVSTGIGALIMVVVFAVQKLVEWFASLEEVQYVWGKVCDGCKKVWDWGVTILKKFDQWYDSLGWIAKGVLALMAPFTAVYGIVKKIINAIHTAQEEEKKNTPKSTGSETGQHTTYRREGNRVIKSTHYYKASDGTVFNTRAEAQAHDKKIKQNTKSVSGGSTSTKSGKGGGGGTHTQTAAEKAAEDVANAEKEYAKSVKKAQTTADLSTDKQEASVKAQQSGLSALQSLYDAYADAYAATGNQGYLAKMRDLMTQIELMTDSTEAAKDALDKTKEAENNAAEARAAYAQATKEIAAKQAKGRDTTFDYKYTGKEGASEKVQAQLEFDLDIAQQQLEALKQKADTLGKESIEGLAEAENKVTDLNTKLNLEKVKQDIQSLQDEMKKGWQDLASNAWQGIESTVNNINSLVETMQDPDASGWEKFCSVIDTLMSLFQTLQGVMETINSITEISTQLKNAETIASQKNAATKTQEAMASSSAALGAAAETTGKAAAKGAELPYPANIAAIASGIAAGLSVVATIISILGSFKNGGFVGAYASGGYINGAYSHGDKNLIGVARVNAGEAILNPRQQRNFMRLANGGGIQSANGGGEVKFKIEGRTLVGVLGNESTRSSKIK